MELKRWIGVLLAALSVSGAASAAVQNPAQEARTEVRPPEEGCVRVRTHGTAAEALARAEWLSRRDRVAGYRVGIFFDNSQNARSLAAAAAERFRELYPGIAVYAWYENPYFKVSVGNCRTQEEAVILWGRIKEQFPKAYIARETIDVGNFAE